MQPNKTVISRSTSLLYLVVLTVIVLSYCVWVLSLPLFPTQDGPMHLYFTHVLHALLTGNGSFYQQYYFIRHVLPPYSLYYYTLMLLSAFVPVLLADKIVICLYFISFAYGFRYLAKAIGPSGELMALPATILLLNWPLGMGFVNFCLSTSLAFWALGLWCRALGRSDHKRKIAFVVMAYLVMLTHPVPLLGLLGFCGIELFIRVVRFWQEGPFSRFRPLSKSILVDAAYVFVASGTLAYVKLFTTKNVLKQTHAASLSYLQSQASDFPGYIFLHSVAVFAGRSPADLAYRLPFYLFLLMALFLAVRRLVRSVRMGAWTLAETWTTISVVFLVGFPFIPANLNNSAYFAARLIIYIWIAALIAASGAWIESSFWRTAVVCVSVACAVVTLGLACQRITPIARDIAATEQLPAMKANSVGLLMHDPGYQISPNITYDPYFWSGARMFRRTESVLYNTPWLDLQIIPLGPRPPMPTYRLGSVPLEVPAGLRRELTASPADREFVLSHIDSEIVSAGRSQASVMPDGLLQADEAGSRKWSCRIEGKYSICTVKSQETAVLQPMQGQVVGH